MTTQTKKPVRRGVRGPAMKKASAAKTVTEEAKLHPVSDLAKVPPKEFLDSYIGRKIDGHREFDIFENSVENKWNVLIEGPTGPGKTSAVMAYAAKKEMPFYAIPSNIGIEPSQLFGKYVPNEEAKAGENQFIWVDGPVTSIIRNGGCLLINEVNFMPERVATVLFGLLDKRRQIILLDRKGETITAHGPDCWCDLDEDECRSKWLFIGADMNPEYEGTRPLNKAFRNRFAIQLLWDYDDNVEKKLVESDHLLKMAKQFRTAVKNGEYETPVSTNMLFEFEQVALKMGLTFAIGNFIAHFNSDERAAAKLVCDTHSAGIAADIETMLGVDEDEDEFAFGEGVNPDGSFTDDDGRTWRVGDVDPEFGVYGTDWGFNLVDVEDE